MYLILIAVSFLASIAFSIFLQRVANSGHYLSRLKKTVHLHEHTLVELANQQNQKIRDSFLDYEMLLQKAQENHSLLHDELEEYAKRLKELRANELLVKELSTHLNEMAASANTISQKVESLDIGMQKLGHAEQEIQKIHERLDILGLELEKKAGQAEQRLEESIAESVREIIHESQTQLQEATQNARSSYGLLEQEREKFRNVLEDYNEQLLSFKEGMQELPQKLEKNWTEALAELSAKSQENRDVLTGAFTHLENQLGAVRTRAVEDLQADLKLMRKEMEDLNLQTMSRRDEILNETKRMAHKVQKQSQLFQEHYLASENRLLEEAESYQKKADEYVQALLHDWGQEQKNRQEKNYQEWEKLRENIADLEKQKLSALDTQAVELKENMESFFQGLKDGLRAEAEKGANSFNKSLRDSEQKWQGQAKFVEELQEEINNRLEQQAQKSFTSLKQEASKLHAEILLELQEKYAKSKKSLQEQLAEQHAFSQDIHSQLGGQRELSKEMKEEISLWLAEKSRKFSADLEEEVKALVSDFESKTQKSLWKAQQDISFAAEELTKNKIDAKEKLSEEAEMQFAKMEENASLYIERQESAYTELKQAASKIESQQEELKSLSESAVEQQNKMRQELEAYSIDAKEKLSEEAEMQFAKMEENASLYIERQESAYTELKQAASKIEKDLRGRLDVDAFLEKAEEEAAKRFEAMKAETFSYFDELEGRKTDLQNNIHVCEGKLSEFEEALKTVDQVDSYIQQLDESLGVLKEGLETAHKENAQISKFSQDFEDLRASRRKLESELSLIESQRKRVLEIEKDITATNEKMTLLGDAKQLALSIEKRVRYFHQFKENFDHYFGEFQERKQYIEEAFGFIEESRQKALQSNGKSQKLLEKVDRTEARQEHLHDRLEQFELRASKLEGMQRQIKEVEVRFEQMDGLMIDLEQKQKQIASMSQRFDDIKNKGEGTMEELNSMFGEADEKMDKLTGFYHLLDTMLDTRLRQEQEEADLSQNLSKTFRRSGKQSQNSLAEHKRDGILSLYLNHKWQPELIAERMKIDLATVKTVIAKHIGSSVKS